MHFAASRLAHESGLTVRTVWAEEMARIQAQMRRYGAFNPDLDARSWRRQEAHLGYLGANTSNRRKGQAEVEEGRPVKSPTPPPSSRVPRIYRMASVSAGRGAQTQLEHARIPEVQGLSSSRSWADGDASR
ncbi:hypothetical protein S40293_11006 [Stachybotrys chartarum IBT 40293]|nr:hypothetical protein S40293_11006 [Stachybotrys chartarum IBT 40293]